MTHNPSITVSEICEIAARYKSDGLRDTSKLLQAVELHFRKERIREADLANYLRANPQLVDCWILWSEDKRWSPAWYLSENSDGTFSVGFYHKDPALREERRYSDKFAACAAFIVHEIEDYLQFTK